jgi:hypothetical protein
MDELEFHHWVGICDYQAERVLFDKYEPKGYIRKKLLHKKHQREEQRAQMQKKSQAFNFQIV